MASPEKQDLSAAVVKPRVPKELKRFIGAMLLIILFIALASVVVALVFGQ